MTKSLDSESNHPSHTPAFLSSEGWYHFGQLFIESTYLQPFKLASNGARKKDQVKINTHNGYIEREIHGAMHASRVAWSTMMLHRLCQQQYPDKVQNKLQALLEFSHLNENELFCLIRYVGLGHDTAREGDCGDRWEKESATRIKHFLTKQGLDSQLVELFSNLAYLKDKPEELVGSLAQFHLSQEAVDGLQYARLLISLADCFDIIRCNGSFDFACIEEKLAEVFPYAKDTDAAVFFDYAKQVLQLLKRQKDLYFPTQLIGPNQEIFSLEEGEEEYSIQEKVKLEHADNAIAAMLDSLNQDPYFKKLLNIESSEFTLYAQEPAFNPYIHGTNSATLALMTQTNFQLMSVIDMLEQYQLAPLCGELTQGGLNSAKAVGEPCFARLNGEDNSNEYSLMKVISNYAKITKTIPKEDCVKQLKKYSTQATSDLFSKISIINIYLVRAKQLGINLEEIPEICSFEQDFHHALDIFYLYLLFSTHLVVKNTEFQTLPYKVKEEIMYKDLSLLNVVEKLRQSKISIRTIYNNPTPENCQKIIDLLTPSARYRIKPLFEYTAEPLIDERGNYSQLDNQYSYMVRNTQYSDSCFEAILSQTCQQQHKMGDFHHIAARLLHYIETLEKRFELTQKLIEEPNRPLILAPEDLDLIENPMPIILCYNQNNHIRIVSMDTQEYRSQQALKLGQDIQTIATDTEANIKRLQAYSNRHHLSLNIISFADLQRANRSLTTDNPLPSQQILNRPLDIKRLNDFCDQQKVRLNNSSVLSSLIRFQEKAKELILSDLSAVEKRTRLKACAHDEFKHRHETPRLLADVLMLISSLILVGLAVGMARVLNGHSFFFSSEKTRREAEFIEIADEMKLGCRG